jgi:hypothetical protein
VIFNISQKKYPNPMMRRILKKTAVFFWQKAYPYFNQNLLTLGGCTNSRQAVFINGRFPFFVYGIDDPYHFFIKAFLLSVCRHRAKFPLGIN